MEFRLYPNPSDEICTPFVHIKENNCYARYFNNNGISPTLISIGIDSFGKIKVIGVDETVVFGTNLPDREILYNYLKDFKTISNSFLDFIETNLVVPTFPLSKEEALVKTIIRQVISAKQAKKLFSNFVKEFGYNKDGIYGFPGIDRLKKISIQELRELGLGFKADRIYSCLNTLGLNKEDSTCTLKGIGSWSKDVLKVELFKDYSSYPFLDKSGEKANKICGVNIQELGRINKKLSSDAYLYAISFMELTRQ